MKAKKYSNYLSNLNPEQVKSLGEFLETSKEMIRQYYSGYSSLTAKRIQKIIEWSKKNTPDNIPTFEELISIPENNKEAV